MNHRHNRFGPSDIAFVMSEFMHTMQESIEEKTGEQCCFVAVVNVDGHTLTVGNLDPEGSHDLLTGALERCDLDREAFRDAAKRRKDAAAGADKAH